MIELPRFANGEPHAVCSTCVAKTWLDGKYYCDEMKLKRVPRDCPRPELKVQTLDPYQILRSRLRK